MEKEKGKKLKVERTAGAILFRKRQDRVLYLLLQRPRGHWVFPGGKIESGESAIETVRREIKEETGLTHIRFLPGFKETMRFRYKWPPKTQDAEDHLKYFVLYLGQVFEHYVEISQEHKNFQWVVFEKARQMLKHRSARELLDKAEAHILGGKNQI